LSQTNPAAVVVDEKPATPPPSLFEFHRRVRVVLGYVALALVVGLLLWLAAEVLMLTFASILLAIFLRGLSDPLAARTGLPPTVALVAVVAGLVLLLALGLLAVAPSLVEQGQKLVNEVPVAYHRLRTELERHEATRPLLAEAPSAAEVKPILLSALSRATAVFSTALGLVASTVICLVLALFWAAEPRTYVEGAVALVPAAGRRRAREVLDGVGNTLRWWLVGRALSMVVVGSGTTLALWLLGVPLALALGFLAGLSTLVPNLGPVVAAVPILLIAFLKGPTEAVWTFAVYLGLQLCEVYLLTPIVQRRTVSLPPAVALLAQIVLGVFWGVLGVALATPLAAAALVVVRLLYVEGVLKAEAPVPEEPQKDRPGPSVASPGPTLDKVPRESP
jgi:predicted PurR-regulated permease PerM